MPARIPNRFALVVSLVALIGAGRPLLPQARGQAADITITAPNGDEVTVCRTEAGKALADKVDEQVGKSLYSLQGEGIAGFEAEFTLQANGQPAGTLRCTRDARTGQYAATAAGAPGLPDAQWVEQLLALALRASLDMQQPAQGRFGAQAGTDYILADYAEVNERVGADISIINSDLSSLTRMQIFTDGAMRETVRRTQKAKGKYYVAGVTVTVRIPNQPERKIEFQLSYTMQYGPAFVKRVKIDDIGPEKRTSWEMVLKNVSFTKAAPPAPAEDSLFEDEAGPGFEVPAETPPAPTGTPEHVTPNTEAEQLTGQVFEGLNRSCYTLFDRGIEAFEAQFSLQRNGAPAGTVALAGEPEEEEIMVSFEGAVDEDLQDWLGSGLEWLLKVSLVTRWRPDPMYVSYSARRGETYVIDGSQDGLVDYRFYVVSADYRRMRDAVRYDDGLELHSSYDFTTEQGKHLLRSATRRIAAEGREFRVIFKVTHAPQDGVLFFQTVDVDDTGPAGRNVWRLERQSVKFYRNGDEDEGDDEDEEEGEGAEGLWRDMPDEW